MKTTEEILIEQNREMIALLKQIRNHLYYPPLKAPVASKDIRHILKKQD